MTGPQSLTPTGVLADVVWALGGPCWDNGYGECGPHSAPYRDCPFPDAAELLHRPIGAPPRPASATDSAAARILLELAPFIEPCDFDDNGFCFAHERSAECGVRNLHSFVATLPGGADVIAGCDRPRPLSDQRRHRNRMTTTKITSRADVDQVATAMLAAYSRHEDTDVPPSYVGVVIEMARAAIEMIQPESRAWVALDAVAGLIPTSSPELIDAGYAVPAADLLDALAKRDFSSEPDGSYVTIQMSSSAPGGEHVIHLGTGLKFGVGDNVCGLSRHGFSIDGDRYGFSVGGGHSDPDARPCLGCVAVAGRKPGPVTGIFKDLFDRVSSPA